MTRGKKITQFILIFFGLFLILVTYYFYPKLNEKNIVENKNEEQNLIDPSKVKIKKPGDSNYLIGEIVDKIDLDILNKNLKEEGKKTAEYEIIKLDKNIANSFENVEYNGVFSLNNDFKIKSKKAFISSEEPDIVLMQNMKVTIYMNDGRIIVITSDKGEYNKVTFDCFFIDNVEASDEGTVIRAQNLDLLATSDTATVYNDVVLINESGSLKADKVKYDFETRYYHISMFNNEKIKMKLIR
jgi:hypothetical protein